MDTNMTGAIEAFNSLFGSEVRLLKRANSILICLKREQEIYETHPKFIIHNSDSELRSVMEEEEMELWHVRTELEQERAMGRYQSVTIPEYLSDRNEITEEINVSQGVMDEVAQKAMKKVKSLLVDKGSRYTDFRLVINHDVTRIFVREISVCWLQLCKMICNMSWDEFWLSLPEHLQQMSENCDINFNDHDLLTAFRQRCLATCENRDVVSLLSIPDNIYPDLVRQALPEWWLECDEFFHLTDHFFHHCLFEGSMCTPIPAVIKYLLEMITNMKVDFDGAKKPLLEKWVVTVMRKKLESYRTTSISSDEAQFISQIQLVDYAHDMTVNQKLAFRAIKRLTAQNKLNYSKPVLSDDYEGDSELQTAFDELITHPIIEYILNNPHASDSEVKDAEKLLLSRLNRIVSLMTKCQAVDLPYSTCLSIIEKLNNLRFLKFGPDSRKTDLNVSILKLQSVTEMMMSRMRVKSTSLVDDIKNRLKDIASATTVFDEHFGKFCKYVTDVVSVIEISETGVTDLMRYIFRIKGLLAESFMYWCLNEEFVDESEKLKLHDILYSFNPQVDWETAFTNCKRSLEQVPDHYSHSKTMLSVYEVGWASRPEQKKALDEEKWRNAKTIIEDKGFNFHIVTFQLTNDITKWNQLANQIKSESCPSFVGSWVKSLRSIQKELLDVIPNLEKFGEFLFSEGRAIVKAKFSFYPHLPRRSFQGKKEKLFSRLSSKLPVESHPLLRQWVFEPESLTCMKTPSQNSPPIQIKLSDEYTFVNSQEETLLIDYLVEQSGKDLSIMSVNEESARKLKEAWDAEDEASPTYTPSVDPITQIPLVGTVEKEFIDYIPELKRISPFNKIISDIPFPKGDFMGFKEKDLNLFKKFAKYQSKKQCQQLKLNWSCGRNGKLIMVSHGKDGQIRNVGSHKNESVFEAPDEKFKTDFLSYVKKFNPNLDSNIFKDLKQPSEKLIDMDKMLTKVVDVMKPIWYLNNEERMKELNRRCKDTHSDQKIKVGTMLKMQNRAFSLIEDTRSILRKCLDEPLNLTEIFEPELIRSFKESSALNLECMKAISSVFECMGKRQYGRFLLLLHEIGASYMNAKAESLTSGKLFVKRLKSFGIDLVISMSGSNAGSSSNHKCCLIGPTTFTSSTVEHGLKTTENMSHCFFLDERLARLYESLIFQYGSTSLLFLQYERCMAGKSTLDDEAQEMVCDVVLNSLFLVMKNNKACNEMVQNYRYVVMGLINDYIDCDEMGKKLSVTCRSSVQHEFKKRMKNSIIEWGQLKQSPKYTQADKSKIIEGEPNHVSLLRPEKGWKSIQSVITEIYLCHLYDREGVQRDTSTTGVFKKSMETQLKFEKEIPDNWQAMLGFDYGLTGESFLENCKKILNLSTSIVGFSGKLVHDSGILCRNHLVNKKAKITDSKLSIGLSDLSNSTSIISKPQLSIDWETAKIANKKSNLIRFIKTTQCNKTQDGVKMEEKLRWIREHFHSDESDYWDKDTESFTKNYLTRKSQALSSFSEAVALLEQMPSALSNDGYVSYLNLFRWLNKHCSRKLKELVNDGSASEALKLIADRTGKPPLETSYQAIDSYLQDLPSLILELFPKEDDQLHKKFAEIWCKAIQIINEHKEEQKFTTLQTLERNYSMLKSELENKPELFKPDEMLEVTTSLDFGSQSLCEAYTLLNLLSGCVLMPRCDMKGKAEIEWDLYIKCFMKSVLGPKLYSLRILPLRFKSEFISGYPLHEVLMSDGLMRTIDSGKSGLESSHKSVISMFMRLEPDWLHGLVVEHLIKFKNIRPETMMAERKIRRKFWQIPSSQRNKVTLELITHMIENCSSHDLFPSSIQKLAEVLILSSEDEFYGLAPKEQFGGVRELGIQDFKTKITNYVSEHCSRSLNRNFNEYELIEGLSHPKAKFYKVDDAIKELRDRNVEPLEGETFKEVIAMNKDHSKWGPTHCPGFNFRCMFLGMKGILQEFWNFFDLKMLASSTKNVEIPRPVVSKILNIPETSKLSEIEEFTKDKLVKGNLCVMKIQDMIQGIHHHTSSLYAMGCQKLMHHLMRKAADKLGYECSMTTVQGSDDEETILILTRKVSLKNDNVEAVRRLIWINKQLEKLINFKTSPKSTYGRVIVEYNSNFSYGEANCAPSIKFCSSQFLMQSVTDFNEVVNSVYSMSQQAMYNSVPLSNILLIALKHYTIYRKQAMMQVNGRNYTGLPITKIPFCLGGIWVPKHSDMLCNNLTRIELEMVSNLLVTNPESEWVLRFFKRSALGLVESNEVKHPSFFELDHKKVTLNQIESAKRNLRTLGLKMRDTIKPNTVKESAIILLESLRTPYTSYTDFCRFSSIIRAEKLSISMIEKSPVTYLRLLTALYRGHYIKLSDGSNSDLCGLIKIYKESADPINKIEFLEVLDTYTKAKDTNEAIVIAQIRSLESSPITMVVKDSSERSAWSDIQITNNQTIIRNEIPTVLLTMLESTDIAVTVPPKFDESHLEVDSRIIKTLCSPQLDKLSKILDSTKDEDKVEGNSLIKEIIHIAQGVSSRAYVIFGPGMRSSSERGFLENIVSRNSVRGLDFNMTMSGFGQFANSSRFNSEDFIELVGLMATLFKEDTLQIMLRYIGENPSIVGISETNLKQVLRSEINCLPEFSVTEKLKLLTLASLIGDTTADERLNDLASLKRQNYQIDSNPGHSCFTTYSGMKIVRTLYNDNSSITLASEMDRELIKGHLSLFKLKAERIGNSALHPKRLFQLGDPDVLQLDSLDTQLIGACQDLNQFVHLISDDLMTCYISRRDLSPETMDVPLYSTKIYIDKSMKQLLRNFDRKPVTTSCDLNIDHNQIRLSYKGKPPIDYLDNQIVNMENALASMKSIQTDRTADLNVAASALEKKLKSLELRRNEASSTEIELCVIRFPRVYSHRIVSQFIKLIQTDTFKAIGDRSHLTVKGNEELPIESSENVEEPEDEATDVSSILSEDVPSLSNLDHATDLSKRVTEKRKALKKDVQIIKDRDNKRNEDLIQKFLDSATSEQIINASDYLRRFREDEIQYSRMWKTATASTITSRYAGVTFEEMTDIYTSGLASETLPTDWSQFFIRNGLKGKTLKFFTIGMIVFHIKWPNMSSVIYKLLSLGSTRSNKLSVTKMILTAETIFPDVNDQLSSSHGRQAEAISTEDDSSMTNRGFENDRYEDFEDSDSDDSSDEESDGGGDVHTLPEIDPSKVSFSKAWLIRDFFKGRQFCTTNDCLHLSLCVGPLLSCISHEAKSHAVVLKGCFITSILINQRGVPEDWESGTVDINSVEVEMSFNLANLQNKEFNRVLCISLVEKGLIKVKRNHKARQMGLSVKDEELYNLRYLKRIEMDKSLKWPTFNTLKLFTGVMQRFKSSLNLF
uniref:RNA-dependent RNA polymerase n=1 Tax=Wuhan snail virus 2 TaxID=1923749 RepID=A0A1L3KPP8_9VIRU|nr:RNA-dependent RNA polymerase [Wuhan snail virus 2]